MTPRRRTLLLAALTDGSVAVLYVGFQATIGGTWDHNHAAEMCAATPTTTGIANRSIGTGATDRWTWWPPGHAHRCIYDMPGGKTIVRPMPK